MANHILISNYGHPSSVVAKSLSTGLLHHIKMQGGALHTMIYSECWDTHKAQLSVPELGVHLSYRPEMLWQWVESVSSSGGRLVRGGGLCVPLHKDKVHERLGSLSQLA